MLKRTFSAHCAFIPHDRANAFPVCVVVILTLQVFRVVAFVFHFRCGSVDPQMGNVKPKRNGRFMKESGPSKRHRLHDEKQTPTPTSDNKLNKESSTGRTKLTWREDRRMVDPGLLAEQTCFQRIFGKRPFEKTTRASTFRLNFHGKANYLFDCGFTL